jgi:hypothetical protein
MRLDKSEILRRLRLGNLRSLFRDRYGPILPDDDAGREDLRELLLPISVGPNANLKMPKAIEVWAPWMQQDEAEALIEDINRTPIQRRKPNARELGERLRVTNAQRERLRLWTIAACDMSRDEAAEWRKAKERARKRRQRQSRGSKPQACSINRTKPWLAEGISRATWYRQRETISSAVKLVKAEDKVVSPEQAELPRRAMWCRGRNRRKNRKVWRKPERQQYTLRCNRPRALRTNLSHELPRSVEAAK